MFENETPEKHKAAIIDTIYLVDHILFLADQTHKTGEDLQLAIVIAESEALKTQLNNLVNLATSQTDRSFSSNRLSELLTKYPSLPKDIFEPVQQKIFQLFPEQPIKKM